MKKLITLIALTLSFSASALSIAPGALKISFHSIGSGIDSVASSLTFSVLGDQMSEGKIYKFERKNWGREGEFDLCIQFNSYRDVFATEKLLRKVVGESDLVNMNVTLNCSQNDSNPPIPSMIKVQGTLMTGIYAIGGETTGIIIRTEKGSFELVVTASQRRELELYNGAKIVVKGQRIELRGVERGPRKAIKVSEFKILN